MREQQTPSVIYIVGFVVTIFILAAFGFLFFSTMFTSGNANEFLMGVTGLAGVITTAIYIAWLKTRRYSLNTAFYYSYISFFGLLCLITIIKIGYVWLS